MAHVATITIDHTKVPGDLTDYVGLIVPDGSAGYSALYALCLEGGGDIRLFKSDDTTELAREIVTFSVSAETGEIHYKYSGTLSSSVATDIHVYADGSSAEPAAGSTYGSEAVWDDYSLVYHMNDLTSTTTQDSTGNGNVGTLQSAMTETTGKIGKAQDQTSSADRITSLADATINNMFDDGGTVQFWLNSKAARTANSGSGSFAHFLNKGSVQFYFGGDAYLAHAFTTTGGRWDYNLAGAFPTGSYQLYHIYYNNSSISNDPKWYKNASLLSATGSVNPSGTRTSDSDTGLTVGDFSSGTRTYNGIWDEFRIRKSEVSANQITAEYNNQNSYSTFYSVAAVAGSSAAQAARRGIVMMM